VARKKHKHEEHENHERWLVSWADFMTLLFALFVVMYATSQVDTKKAQQVAQSVRFAMHFEGTGGVGALPLFDGPPSEGGCVANTGTSPRSTQEQAAIVETMRRKLQDKLAPLLQDKSTENSVKLDAEPGRLAIRLAAARFFDPAHAALRPEMIPVLDAIAGELAALQKPVRVEGHTDDSPTPGAGSGRFRNNWDLSAARAVSVVSYLEDVHRMDPRSLSAVGFGSTHPVADNTLAEGREENRRIELVVELPPGSGKGLPVR
jgi:chemotaxis protein MotB